MMVQSLTTKMSAINVTLSSKKVNVLVYSGALTQSTWRKNILTEILQAMAAP